MNMKKMPDCVTKPHLETKLSISGKLYKDDSNSEAVMSTDYSDKFDVKLICIVGVIAVIIVLCKLCCFMTCRRK